MANNQYNMLTIKEIHDKIDEENETDGNDYELSHKFQMVEQQQKQLKLNHNKRNGIDPEQLDENDILTSIHEGTHAKNNMSNNDNPDTDEIEIQVNKPLAEMIWISRKSKFHVIFKFLYVLSCLISSYMYAWISVFGSKQN